MGPGLLIGGGGGLLLLLLYLLFGGDPSGLVQQLPSGEPGGRFHDEPVAPGEIVQTGDVEDDQRAQFVAAILGSTEEVWHDLFRQMGRRYEEPRLVLFRDRVQSACGMAGAAVGPFYCPADSKAYLDLDFFDELARRFGAPGDFAQAYVLAHEIGHHVQNLLGISDQVHAARGRLSEREANQLSVRLELQADFFAGVWAHHAQRARRILEPGDLEEGLAAASAIGDDRIQKQAQGYVVPDAFTHGTSAQRVRWFRLGFETGDVSQGDTFDAVEP